MALQPRFDQAVSEKITPLYSVSSEVRPVTGPCRCSRHPHPHTWISVFLGFVCLPARPYTELSVVGVRHLYRMPSLAQSIALHDPDDIWAVELPIEFVYYFWAKYRAENLLLKDE
jgi:hypothetical protein